MGIHGLWPLLKVTSTPITLDELEGKRLAIDISLWIHQAQYFDIDKQSSKPHLTILINRIAKLLFYKIRPVFVFDGDNLPRFKKQILRDRMLKSHLQEFNTNRGQKRIFERVANGHLNSDRPENVPLKNYKIVNCGNTTANTLDDCNIPSTSNLKSLSNDSDSDISSDNFVNDSGIYSSKIDAQISRLEEHCERERNTLLKQSDIPDDAKQFSNFQLQRLLQRNQTNYNLKKLKEERVRNIIDISQNDYNGIKVIIADKFQQVHVLPPTGGFDDKIVKSTFYENFDTVHKCKVTSQSASISSDDNSDDFIDVSDPELIDDSDACSTITNDIEVVDEFTFVKSDGNNSPRISSESVEEFNEIVANKDDFLLPKNSSKNKLNGNNSKAERDGIYADCQKLLFILGLPFMESPAEAEAQCAELERLNLVDGIVSDDSDVWLFGAKHVYKNMFSRKMNLEKYSSEDIRRKLGGQNKIIFLIFNKGLTRCGFIQLGLLAVGDYSEGLKQIGVVAALELISEFLTSSDDVDNLLDKVLCSLKKISEWILSKRLKDNNSVFVESPRRISLRKIIEANNSDETIKMFPNIEIIEAYAKPLVDSSKKKSKWGRIDFVALDSFLQINLGITKEDIFKKTHGAFERWNDFITAETQSFQQKITNFTKVLPSLESTSTNILSPTERVKKAVKKLKNNQRE
uniref:Uncharacterized protein n=1 Tax=Meloidogyne incognita TaxID=6306 RepID=A0A914NDP2_MELIC